MAKGILNIQAADGAVIGLHVPDGLTSGERQISLGVNLSGITAYHIYNGSVEVTNTVLTNGFGTTLYTGNGSTQSINTGIDMSTQWGNTAEEKFGGLVWQKYKSAVAGHRLFDTINGVNKYTDTSTTGSILSVANTLTSFNNNGFSLGSTADTNSSGAIAVTWNFQTTHRISGTTNHGQAYTCHYNPYTGFTMVQYTGSGLAGHEIPHMLGRKLGFVIIKNLSAVTDWYAYNHPSQSYGFLNKTDSFVAETSNSTDVSFRFPSVAGVYNTSTNQYILYGWANSYFDKLNKLIGNYEIGVYQGTGASGNKVTTRGKPSWVMIKRLDSTSDWDIFDNQRGTTSQDYGLFPNLSNAESIASDRLDYNTDGFTLKDATSERNASGGQYLYMVAYDTNANGGGSYYPLASDTANLQVNNAIIPFANGIDSNGAKNTILSKNETITGLTYTAGKNYVYCDSTGAYGVSAHKPRYLESELIRTYAGETPDYYNVKENKWYSTSGGSELLGTTGWTATGGTLTTVGGYNQFVDTTLTGYVSKTISTVVGKAYTIVLKIFGTREANITINNVEYQWVNGTFIGTKTINFVANGVATVIAINDGSGSSYTIQFSASMFETAILPSTAITNSRNYMNTIVYADNDGGVLYVEELPKIEYKDIVKANEFKGKNACTAWVNFDGTTTPPTIRDSYNVSAVIRTGIGTYDIYFKEPMENTNYGVFGTSSNSGSAYGSYVLSGAPTAFANDGKFLNKVTIGVVNTNAMHNPISASIEIKGGKN